MESRSKTFDFDFRFSILCIIISFFNSDFQLRHPSYWTDSNEVILTQLHTFLLCLIFWIHPRLVRTVQPQGEDTAIWGIAKFRSWFFNQHLELNFSISKHLPHYYLPTLPRHPGQSHQTQKNRIIGLINGETHRQRGDVALQLLYLSFRAIHWSLLL